MIVFGDSSKDCNSSESNIEMLIILFATPVQEIWPSPKLPPYIYTSLHDFFISSLPSVGVSVETHSGVSKRNLNIIRSFREPSTEKLNTKVSRKSKMHLYL